MPRTGRPKAVLVLSEEEKATLLRWSKRAKSAQALALRCRIVLACAEGASNKEVAAQLGCAPVTVSKWRARFVAQRLDGLADEDRPGRPASITIEQVEAVVVATLEATPKDATHWSRTSMAKKSGLSKSTVGRIWRDFGLKPHRSDTFKLSTDPLFVEKVVDVVGLYHNPPEKAVVLCVDEKAQIQALDRSQPVLPMMPGMPERRTHDYYRNGITSLFAAFDIADGTVISELHHQHRATEFKKFLTTIDKTVPEGLDIHIVCDNYGTHKTPAIKGWLAKHPRVQMHFTPTGSSWLNQVERWFGFLTDQKIRRGAHKSVQALEVDIRSWIKAWNDNPKPFVWKKSAEEDPRFPRPISSADFRRRTLAQHTGVSVAGGRTATIVEELKIDLVPDPQGLFTIDVPTLSARARASTPGGGWWDLVGYLSDEPGVVLVGNLDEAPQEVCLFIRANTPSWLRREYRV